MRLTRREFIKASAATAALLAAGCATQRVGPVSAALAPHKAEPSAPAVGEWVGSTCQGCTQWCAIQIFVQSGRATAVRGNPLSKTNHGYVCPRGHMISAAGLRPGPDQGADEAHEPDEGARRRPEVRCHQLGRGAGHGRRPDGRAAQGGRAGQARLHARPLLADVDRSVVRHAAQDLRARPTTFRTARSAPKPRRWARG